MNKIFNKNFKDNFNKINKEIEYDKYAKSIKKKKTIYFLIPLSAIALCLIISIPLAFKNTTSKVYALNNVNRIYNSSNKPLNKNYINSLKEFTINFNESLNKDENIIYSPLSIQTCFTLLLEGANNNSYDELKNALCYNDSFSYSKEILAMLNNTTKSTKTTSLELNQSIWLDNSYKDSINQNYLEKLTNNYYAEVFMGDLKTNEAHEELASYINKKTHNTLNVNSDDFNDYDGIMYLLSTIYLKSYWASSFKEELNYTDNFKNNDQSLSQVTYMQNKELKTLAYSNSNFTIISLPLQNNLKANLLLTNEDLTIYNEKETLNTLLNFKDLNTKYVSANITLPKFKIQGSYNLNDNFQRLNVHDIFDAKKANLSNIIDSNFNIFVSKSKHEACIEFSNFGVEATAYTSTELVPEVEAEDYIKINFNKPFMFVLNDMNDLPLFVGMVNKL